MKGATIVALILVGGGLLAHLLLSDPGYVAVRVGRSLLETTLPVFVLALAGAYALARGLERAFASRRRLAGLRSERRRRRAREDTQRGLLELAAGQWKSAEDLLARAAPDADSAAANYLVAARAADLLDATARRDEWLSRAQEETPEARTAAHITLAEMQMRRGQDEAALQSLDRLDASGDLNSRGLELTARLCQQLGLTDRLRALLPRLKESGALPQPQVDELVALVRLADVRTAGERGDAKALEQAWSELPRSVRRLPQSMAAYARAAMACGDHPAAERALGELIDHAPEAGAIRLYGELVLADPLQPELLASCARLCLRAELFGKARSYLEASLARRPNAENSLILADLLEQMGERDAAVRCLRDSVTRSVGRRPNLPRVRLRRH